MTIELMANVPASGLAGAIDALRGGRPVVLSDGGHRRGDIVYPAQLIDTAQMAYLVRHTSGLVQVAMPDSVCDALSLPPMLGAGRYGSQPCVATDVCGVGTGISAADRAATARALGDPTATAESFVRPGHVIPVRVPDAAELQRPGDFAAGVLRLMRLAGFRPAAVSATIVDTLGGLHLAEEAELDRFADRHGLALVGLDELTEAESGGVSAQHRVRGGQCSEIEHRHDEIAGTLRDAW